MPATLTLTARRAVMTRISRPPALRRALAALRPALRTAARAFDRMVQPPALARGPELLPEWFKYPPI